MFEFQSECFNSKILSDIYDIYMKAICFYYAKTEMYDRCITDKRSLNDFTEAYIDNQYKRSISNSYALKLYSNIKQYLVCKCFTAFDRELWNSIKQKYYNISAQSWIDMYYYYIEYNDLTILELNKIFK